MATPFQFFRGHEPDRATKKEGEDRVRERLANMPRPIGQLF